MYDLDHAFIFAHFRELRAVDGDTIKGIVDTGFGGLHKFACRLNLIDTPEAHTRFREAGDLVTEVIRKVWLVPHILDHQSNLLQMVSLELVPGAGGVSFNRVIGDFRRRTADGWEYLTDWLLRNRLANQWIPGSTQQQRYWAWSEERLQEAMEAAERLLEAN